MPGSSSSRGVGLEGQDSVGEPGEYGEDPHLGWSRAPAWLCAALADCAEHLPCGGPGQLPAETPSLSSPGSHLLGSSPSEMSPWGPSLKSPLREGGTWGAAGHRTAGRVCQKRCWRSSLCCRTRQGEAACTDCTRGTPEKLPMAGNAGAASGHQTCRSQVPSCQLLNI